MSRIAILLIIAHIDRVINVPLTNEKLTQTFRVTPNQLNAVSGHGNDHLPILIPITQPHHVTFLEKPNYRKKKGPNIPLSLPMQHHLLQTLHVIPIHSNFHQSHINHILSNNKRPIVSHSYSHSRSNITQSTQLIPILIPFHTHLVPLHDLTVIPLHRDVHHVESKLSHYRTSSEKRDMEEEEPMNRFRSFYGGFGNGLYIGGHGAGHGFYAYG